jgi:hypothetical protein
VYVTLGLESRVSAHRLFAHRLWIVAERYRSLLTEVNDGLVDANVLVGRRDQLVAELDGIYQFAFGVDQAAHEKLRLAPVADNRAA